MRPAIVSGIVNGRGMHWSAIGPLQHGGFLPREWLAAKGLLAMIFFF